MKQKIDVSSKRIEIEFRSMFSKKKYHLLKKFLDKNAKNLGRDDKDVYFFTFPDKLLKVVNNISRKNAQIVLKLNRISKGSDFEELEIPIEQKQVKKAVEIFQRLNIAEMVIHSFQKRHNYRYKGVELALKFSPELQHHLEIEVMINNKIQKRAAEEKIKAVAKELGVNLMTEKELAKLVKKVESGHRKKKK